MCKKVKDIESSSPSFWFFFIVSFICIVLTLWAQYRIISTVKAYESQMEKLHATLIVDSTSNPVLNIDSVCAILNAQGKVKDKNERVLRYCLTEIDAYVQEEITRSNNACTLYASEIKNLLDAQYYRIRQEYEALQTWCAILTIVFLVFSFYSLYKADDMVNKGRKGLRELETINREGQANFDRIQKEAETSLFELKQKIALQTEDMNTKVRCVEGKIDSASNTINSEVARLTKSVDDKISDAEKSYKEKMDQVVSDAEKKIANSNEELASIKKILETLKEEVEVYKTVAMYPQGSDQIKDKR